MPSTRPVFELRLIIALLALGSARPVSAHPDGAAVGLSPDAGLTPLRNLGSWFVDESGSLGLDAIMEAGFFAEPRVNFGIGNRTVWSRFELRAEAGGEWTLFTRLHKIDRIDAFVVRSDGSVSAMAAGTETAIADRQWRYRRPAFSFPMAAGEAVTVYVSMRGRSRLYRDFQVGPSQRFFDYVMADEGFLFFYFGGIVVIALYNLFIYAITRDRNYLLYCAYVFCMLMYQVSVEGYGDAYLWPGWHWFMPRAYNVFIAAAFTLGILFTRSYLALREHSPRLDAAGRALAIVFAATGLACLASTSAWLVDFGTACVLAGAAFILTSAYYTLRKRYEPAVYYAAAWTVLALGVVVTTAKRVGWLPHNRLTEYALHVSNLFEAVLLALALGDRVRAQNRRRLEAEEALIDANARVLQNRMKPHFLFNSMNIIFGQLRESPEAAQDTLALLSDNYHYLSETDGRSLVPLSEEWAFLENYLALMERRWPGQLELTLSLDPRLARLPVPPVILQPLAENAFKYGLRRAERKRLSAGASVEGGIVVMTVVNPACAPLGRVDYGRSLGNIRARLRRYYPDAELVVSGDGGDIVSRISFAFPGGTSP